jgi:RNA methyltransferase, TrmH family
MPKKFERRKEPLEINSLSNLKIKKITKLLKDGPERQAEGIIIVDGLREIEEALRAGWEISEFFYCPELVEKNKKGPESKNMVFLSKDAYSLTKKVFEKISYKKTPDGFLAVLNHKEKKLKDFKLKNNPLILVLESVEKPGNLGGIIRTAYASGVDLVILNNQKTDFYSPNVIRSSTGFIFSVPLVIASIEETNKYLKEKNIPVFLTAIKDAKNYLEADFKKGGAIVFGTEAFGLSDNWLNKKFTKIKIPMIEGVDSLNVSVSVGIIIYEALRQKNI